MIVTDKGTPTRGTYAQVEVELSNSCLIDFFYQPTFYDFIVNEDTGDVHLQVPGLYHYEYGKFVAFDLPCVLI